MILHLGAKWTTEIQSQHRDVHLFTVAQRNPDSWRDHRIRDTLNLELVSFDVGKADDICASEPAFGGTGFEVVTADIVNLKIFIFAYIKHEVHADDEECLKPVFDTAMIFHVCSVSYANVACTLPDASHWLSEIGRSLAHEENRVQMSPRKKVIDLLNDFDV